MKIDIETCIACQECLDHCPMGCIFESDGEVFIDQDECVECSACLKAQVCPTDSLYLPPEVKDFPRWLRATFSDPAEQFPVSFSTGKQGGRGTEEMKTNDVTGKIRRGDLGMTLEFGRPGTGTRLGEVEKVTSVICPLGVHLDPANPVTVLIEDQDTGLMKPEVKAEKVLSCILEFTFPLSMLEDLIDHVQEALRLVDTVVSWGVITRFDESGQLMFKDRLEDMGLALRPNAKINVGLGRPLIDA